MPAYKDFSQKIVLVQKELQDLDDGNFRRREITNLEHYGDSFMVGHGLASEKLVGDAT